MRTASITVTGPTVAGITVNGPNTAVVMVSTGLSLPTQTGNSGKFLTTNGTTASWATVSGGGGGVTSVGLVGTANQITVTGTSPITSTGSFTLSFPAGGVTLPGTTTGTFSGSINGLTVTTSTGTITITNGKTFTSSNTLTLTGTDGSTLNVGTGGTLGSAALLTATTVGGNLVTLPNPSAVTFLRVNADNSVTARTAAEMLSDLGGLSTASAASSYQPLDADLTAIAALTTQSFGRGLLALSDATAVRSYISVPFGTGTSTGNNTGDQDLSGYLTVGGILNSDAGAILSDGSGNLTVTSVTGSLVGNADTATYSTTSGTANYATSAASAVTISGVNAVANGGTGRSTSTTAYGLIAAGTTATGAHQTLAAGTTAQILVGGGASALPVWTTATGSGAPVRATSPTLVTPALGTPTAGVLTSCTGLPLTTGVTGTFTAGNPVYATSTTALGTFANAVFSTTTVNSTFSNSATGIIPFRIDGLSGTTVDLFQIRLNNNLRFAFTKDGFFSIVDTSGSTNLGFFVGDSSNGGVASRPGTDNFPGFTVCGNSTPNNNMLQLAQTLGGNNYWVNDKRGRPITGNTTPTVAAGVGAGTTPTVTMVAGSNDAAGTVSVVTGTSPTASAVVATITFSTAYTATPKVVLIKAANANAAALSGTGAVWAVTASTTTWTLNVGSTNLAASTTYLFQYFVIG